MGGITFGHEMPNGKLLLEEVGDTPARIIIDAEAAAHYVRAASWLSFVPDSCFAREFSAAPVIRSAGMVKPYNDRCADIQANNSGTIGTGFEQFSGEDE